MAHAATRRVLAQEPATPRREDRLLIAKDIAVIRDGTQPDPTVRARPDMLRNQARYRGYGHHGRERRHC